MEDLGYETYQKILTQAVTELKNDEFQDLYAEQIAQGEAISGDDFVDDCAVESALEMYFPDNYVVVADVVDDASEGCALVESTLCVGDKLHLHPALSKDNLFAAQASSYSSQRHDQHKRKKREAVDGRLASGFGKRGRRDLEGHRRREAIEGSHLPILLPHSPTVPPSSSSPGKDSSTPRAQAYFFSQRQIVAREAWVRHCI